MQLKHMHQVSADASFYVVVLGLLSANEQVPNFSPNLNQAEEPWKAQTGNLRFHYSPHQKVKEEA